MSALTCLPLTRQSTSTVQDGFQGRFPKLCRRALGPGSVHLGVPRLPFFPQNAKLGVCAPWLWLMKSGPEERPASNLVLSRASRFGPKFQRKCGDTVLSTSSKMSGYKTKGTHGTNKADLLVAVMSRAGGEGFLCASPYMKEWHPCRILYLQRTLCHRKPVSTHAGASILGRIDCMYGGYATSVRIEQCVRRGFSNRVSRHQGVPQNALRGSS